MGNEKTEKEILELERQLIDYKGEDKVVHFTDYLLSRVETQGGKVFDCGFLSFNRKMKGIKTGELITVTGPTGEGKTLFVESWMQSMILEDAVMGNVKFCIFSFESSPEDMLAKYVSKDTYPIYLPMQLEVMNFDWLYKRVYEAKLKEGCNVFVFDHLHFLVDMSTKQNQSLNIGAFMRKMKHDIAKALNVCVIMIAHQKGKVKGEEPSLEGIRDSALIAGESDTVIVVWRKENFEGGELDKLLLKNPIIFEAVKARIDGMESNGGDYYQQFAMVQIAKGRRAGVYRWPKLFQKVNNFLEEV